MAATRFVSLRACSDPPGLSYSINIPPYRAPPSNSGSLASSYGVSVRCQHDLTGANSAVVVKAAASESTAFVTSDPKTHEPARLLDLDSLQQNAVKYAFIAFKVVTKRRPWKLIAQTLIDKAVIDCRFFTMFGVVGCLVGSVLCFFEGCFFVMESYLQYFNALTRNSDHHVDVMHLLIEALDMYLIGTALLVFGMGMHVMFLGSTQLKGKATSHLRASSSFGLFSLERLPIWFGMQTVVQAKSRIGHAVMMMMQVGLLEKFKTVPMVTGLDLACFAAALFVSSACIFVLSRLSFNHN